MRKKLLQKSVILLVVAAMLPIAILSWVLASPGMAPRDSFQPRSLAPQGSGVGEGSQLAVAADQVQSPDSSGFASRHDVSPPLRDIPVAFETPPTTVREMEGPVKNEDLGRAATGRPQIADPVLQNSFSGLPWQVNAFVAGVNFEGINNLDAVYPPDTNGDVGPNHYVQMVNLHFAIYSKTGTLLYDPAPANTLWTGFGGACQTSNDGDPIVLYDKIADRWILSQFVATSPYGECLAVSTTPDPTGSYNRYFFAFSSTDFYDYPKLGIWPDGYYLSAVRFSTTAFLGSSAIALDRTAMLAGAAAAYQEFKTSTAYGVLLPSSLDGSALPPAGSPNYFVEIGFTALHLWKFHVDWATPANSILTGLADLPVAAYNVLCPGTRSCIPQPGTAIKVDGLGDRLMHRLAYRNLGAYESLVVTHNVNAAASGTQAGVRWYEIRSPNGAAFLYQQGTYAPDANHRWLGSAAMDKLGNIALGYSVSSGAVFPSIRYTGRLVSDPLGLMTEIETSLIAGSGSQTGSASRWGDYANMAVDPVDDCTFWFTSEYLTTTGTAPWRTRIGSFRFSNCIPGPPPTATFTPTPTTTATATTTKTASATATRSASATATKTASATATRTATAATATRTATAATPTRTATATPTLTATATATKTATATPTKTVTVTPTVAVPRESKIYLPMIMK
jgi:hypothetical protein